uniref:Ras suppressor protein 1 n=1 Tax=Coturnix japonica TaxID=93934 RepID=A0A8C2T0E6_COTJA
MPNKTYGITESLQEEESVKNTMKERKKNLNKVTHCCPPTSYVSNHKKNTTAELLKRRSLKERAVVEPCFCLGSYLVSHHTAGFESQQANNMNRLNTLPRGFGSLPALEVLDLTYNNLNENSLPGNFFYLTTLRALYLSDNDFEILPPDIGKLTKLQILSLRDNDLISLPKEIGELNQLKELHIQGNRLTVLPPELGNLDLTGQKQVFKAENNPWVTPIADQFQLGVSHVFEYIRSETYKYLYGRHMQANPEPPKKNNDKSKKISRKPLAARNK